MHATIPHSHPGSGRCFLCGSAFELFANRTLRTGLLSCNNPSWRPAWRLSVPSDRNAGEPGPGAVGVGGGRFLLCSGQELECQRHTSGNYNHKSPTPCGRRGQPCFGSSAAVASPWPIWLGTQGRREGEKKGGCAASQKGEELLLRRDFPSNLSSHGCHPSCSDSSFLNGFQTPIKKMSHIQGRGVQ